MTEPTTVTEFLHKHGLPYAAAFEENGHDHLPSLLEASEEDLATVISDVKMRDQSNDKPSNTPIKLKKSNLQPLGRCPRALRSAETMGACWRV